MNYNDKRFPEIQCYAIMATSLNITDFPTDPTTQMFVFDLC